ncbi:MAG: hypothetical protein WCG25_07585 [bacterium]
MIANCSIDQSKISVLSDLEAKYKETKKQVKEAKAKMKNDTNLPTT